MVDEIDNPQQYAMAEVRPLIAAHQGRVNVTWNGQNADLPDPVAWDMTDGDVKALASEAIRGGFRGMRADQGVNLGDYVVEKFASNEATPYNRYVIRPKTPFGGGSSYDSPQDKAVIDQIAADMQDQTQAEAAKKARQFMKANEEAPDNHFRLRYEEGESGWAEDLGDGTARLLNLPLAEHLNIHDVVRLETASDGRRVAGKVVSRELPKKIGFHYPAPHHENWDKLRKALPGDVYLEGMVVGMAMIACKADFDFVACAKAAGVDVFDVQDLLQ